MEQLVDFEAVRIPDELGPLPPGVAGIIAERRRQIEQEGYADPHDDKWQADQLIGAAMSYLHVEWHGYSHQPPMWPWLGHYWKPKTRRRNLERAGALIAAELARMDRAAGGAS